MTTHYWHPHTGGIETVAAEQAREFVDRGWSVAAYSSWSDRSVERTERRGPFTLERLPAFNPLERALRVPVPFLGPGAAASLRRAAARADVVVAHGHVYPISVAAARAATATQRPFVLVQHNPWVDYPFPLSAVERGADRLVGRRVIDRAHTVVCVSAFTERYVRSISPNAATVVVPNGVDDRRFRPPTTFDAHGRVRFVCVRRLVPRNGVDLLLEAWRLAGVGERAELVVAGNGPERATLEAMAVDDPSVRFAGRVSDDELVHLMQRAHASVVPTRSGEGFGLVAAESHACGTPVIATDQGALREVVRHEVDGLLVPCDDATALANAIRRLVDDASVRDRLRRGALTTDWSWRRSSDALETVLRDAISCPRPRC